MADLSYLFYQSNDIVRDIERNLPVEISSTGYEIRTSRDYHWDNAKHLYAHYHIIQYTLSGWGYYEYLKDGRRLREKVGPNKLFIASWDNPFEYFYDGGPPYEFRWLTLLGSFADQVTKALREVSPVIELPESSATALFLDNLQKRLAGPHHLDHYALTSLGYEFLIQLLKETSAAAASPEERFLMEARDYVKRNIASASVRSLAQHFGYGEKYFNDYFKKRARTTPNRFIIEQRLRVASSLLVNTRKKVSVVASEIGFSEDNYFSKVFKKYYGLCPAEYREQNKDMVPVNEIVVL